MSALKLALVGFSGIFTLFALIPFCDVGTDENTVKTLNWYYSTDAGGDCTWYISLIKSYIDCSGFVSFETWSDCADQGFDDCKACDPAGQAAGGLCFFAFLFGLLGTVFSLVRISRDSAAIKWGTFIMYAFGTLFAFASLIAFQPCVAALVHYDGGTYTAQAPVGLLSIALIGYFVLMVLNGCVQPFSVVGGGMGSQA